MYIRTKNQNKGFVISDLHLFTSRSDVIAANEIGSLSENADFCVLNGDIFDFKWSDSASIEEAVVVAIEFINNLCKKYPNCHFYYVLGNHDCFVGFVEELHAIGYTNFSCHDTHLCLGKNLFLHGDLPLNNKNAFDRCLVQTEYKKTNFANFLYDSVISLRLHMLVSFFLLPSRCVGKIYESIRKHRPHLLGEIKNVYFGHTHIPFNNFFYKGMYFHNTGSAIKYLEINPLEVSYEEK